MNNILERFSLQGKVALLTGGAGLYGRQITSALAQAGARTYIASRNLEALEAEAARHRETGYEVSALPLDQGDRQSVLQLKTEILKREGKIDILVNNAVFRPMKSWNDDPANFAASMQVNATGLFMVTRAFGEAMAAAGGGSIINIGSMYGLVGPDRSLYTGLDLAGGVPDYYFHKGGLINFTRYVASYYGPCQVRCNCVSPGGLASERTTAEFVKRYSERTFLGRMADNTDLMGIIVYLASDASLYVTGANIPVDGGYTAK